MTENRYNEVDKQLTGKNNKRLYSTVRLADSSTAALRDTVDVLPGNVSIPSEESVLEAKDWVDNGSRT